MIFKFVGGQSESRLRLIPKSEQSVIRLNEDELIDPTKNFTEVHDGSQVICLSGVMFQCDDAYPAFVVIGDLTYTTTWSIYINGEFITTFGQSGEYEYIEQIPIHVLNGMLMVRYGSNGSLLFGALDYNTVRLSLVPDDPSEASVLTLDSICDLSSDQFNNYPWNGDEGESRFASLSMGTLSICLQGDGNVETYIVS